MIIDLCFENKMTKHGPNWKFQPNKYNTKYPELFSFVLVLQALQIRQCDPPVLCQNSK